MIIVSGRIFVRPEQRDAFVLASVWAVALVPQTAGCRDFAVAADPIERDRANVYE